MPDSYDLTEKTEDPKDAVIAKYAKEIRDLKAVIDEMSEEVEQLKESNEKLARENALLQGPPTAPTAPPQPALMPIDLRLTANADLIHRTLEEMLDNVYRQRAAARQGQHYNVPHAGLPDAIILAQALLMLQQEHNIYLTQAQPDAPAKPDSNT